jgi:hypothetical protein
MSWTEDKILYKRSVYGGTVFGNTISLSNDAGKSTYALMAVSPSNIVNVLWLDTISGKEMFSSEKGGRGTLVYFRPK